MAASRPGTSCMIGPVFVDTNVLVYRHDASDPLKQSRAHDWLTFLAHRRSGRPRFQVLREFHVTLTRKMKPGFDDLRLPGS